MSIHEILIHRLEHEAACDDEAGLLVVEVALEFERPGFLELHGDRYGFPLAEDFEFDLVAFEFPLHHFVQWHSLVLKRNGAVARHGVSVDFQNHITGLQVAIGCASAVNAAHLDAGGLIFEAQRTAGGGIEEVAVGQGQIHIVVVVAILHILQKPLDHRCGNHIAHILCDISAVALECDADDLAVLHHRSTAVAGIDGCIDLYGEVGIHAGVRVGLEVDARNDAARHG